MSLLITLQFVLDLVRRIVTNPVDVLTLACLTLSSWSMDHLYVDKLLSLRHGSTGKLLTL